MHVFALVNSLIRRLHSQLSTLYRQLLARLLLHPLDQIESGLTVSSVGAISLLLNTPIIAGSERAFASYQRRAAEWIRA